jgi:hypothetical protein
MEHVTRFTLTNQHLALLKRANIRWEPYGSDGAPAVDGKRPYGNQDWETDVCEILGFPKRDNSEYGEEEDEVYSKSQRATAMRIHRETEIALLICVQNLSFAPGIYELKGAFNYSDWTRVEDGKDA